VDAFDSLLSNRVYRRAVSHDEAVRLIAIESGTHFDPAVIEAFLRVSATLAGEGAPPGSPIADS
jgi:response regulator RpfG family c-di-GMP phosphodiesterase